MVQYAINWDIFMQNPREDLQILPLIRDRWSPRAFDGSTIDKATLETLLEAARWAPSSHNQQPWRFAFSLRDDANWQNFLNLLIPFNQEWAASASALVFIASEREGIAPDGTEFTSYSHSFDAGAAWAYLALEALSRGFHTHAMTGLEFEQATTSLGLPDRFRLEAAVAIGRIGDPAQLNEFMREREGPSDRLPLAELVGHGKFEVS